MSGNKRRTTSQSAAAARAALLRHKTLSRLEAALQLLVTRYGHRATLGEVLAITAGLVRLCHSDRVTVAEIADATGLRKQNVSRWAQKRLGRSIEIRSNEDDARIKEIVLLDPKRGQEYIEELGQTLGIDP